MTIYERIMAVKTPDPEFTTKDYLDARDAVIRSEITGMSDRVTNALGDIKSDMDVRFGAIETTIESGFNLRPTTSNLHRSVAAGVGSILVVLLAVLGIVWAALDTGASMTASFSDEVLETQRAHQTQARQIQAMDAKYEQIDNKLDALILAAARPAGEVSLEQPRFDVKNAPEKEKR